MNNEIIFSERQQFKKNWFIILFAIAFILNRVLQSYCGDAVYYNNLFIMWLPSYCLVIIALLLRSIRLETAIREDGIYYQLFPFQWKMKKISFDDIEQIYVRNYHPIMEYGGWGIRLGLFGKGWAIDISGNKGIQIIFKDQKKRKFLLGTQKPEEAETALNTFLSKQKK